MDDYSAIVRQALERLGPMRARDERETEENKARLTRLAAYLIHKQNPDVGLLAKTYGNNVMGLSVDLVVERTTGNFADVATDVDDGDGFRRIAAQWIALPADVNTSDRSRWVEPTAALAGLSEPPEPARPPSTPPPDEVVDDSAVRFDAIDARLSGLEAGLRRQAKTLDQTLQAVNRSLALLEELGTSIRR
jgi:hypothetical protein